MISDELRQRLESLNREPLSAPPHRQADLPVAGHPLADAAPPHIEALFAGREARCADGACYVIRRRLSEWCPAEAGFIRRFAELTGRAAAMAASRPGLAELARALPHSAVYLDIETCGFAGMPVFLVGLLRVRGDDPAIEQLFARHYGEERALLVQLAGSIGSDELLVTFNGKSFDWPCLCDRGSIHRVAFPRQRPHCDLLHEARRAWGASLPDCRLQTLEAHKCGRRRVGDIPGAAIPDAYHRYVQTGDARSIREVITHNALDLLTLAELSARLLWEPLAKPASKA